MYKNGLKPICAFTCPFYFNQKNYPFFTFLRSLRVCFSLWVTSVPFVSCSSFFRLSKSSLFSGRGRCEAIDLFCILSCDLLPFIVIIKDFFTCRKNHTIPHQQPKYFYANEAMSRWAVSRPLTSAPSTVPISGPLYNPSPAKNRVFSTPFSIVLIASAPPTVS